MRFLALERMTGWLNRCSDGWRNGDGISTRWWFMEDVCQYEAAEALAVLH